MRLGVAEEQGGGEGLVGPRLPVGKGEFEADQFEADQHVLRLKYRVESVSDHSLFAIYEWGNGRMGMGEEACSCTHTRGHKASGVEQGGEGHRAFHRAPSQGPA